MQPARLLALKISLTILGVLLVILGIFGVIGYLQSEKRVEWNFASRIEQITNRPKFLERLGQPGERVPPFARNLIFVGPVETITTGFLTNMEVDLSFLNTLPLGQVNRVEIEENNLQIYGKQLSNGRVFLYESADLKKEFQSGLLIWGGFAVILFSLVLYAIALRVSKLTLTPIEQARARSLSYNRYLAHELKTPLAVIQSDLELTRVGKVYDPAAINSSLDEITLMQQTIDSLLTLSEAESTLARAPTQLAPLVQEIRAELSKLPIADGKIFKVSVPDTLTLSAVPTLLRTLLRNIIENALKYGAPGEIKIEYAPHLLRISNPVSPGVRVDIKSIFTEFVGTPGAGNGLGLALVERIAGLHGWSVRAEQSGEIFTIVIDGLTTSRE